MTVLLWLVVEQWAAVTIGQERAQRRSKVGRRRVLRDAAEDLGGCPNLLHVTMEAIALPGRKSRHHEPIRINEACSLRERQ
jgi:hypothetical protein